MLSVILTVYNREPLVLLNTFRALAKNDLEDVEFVVVDDGSDLDYSGLLESLGDLPVRWIKHSTLEHRPETYHIGGHNNPAHVNNVAIREAKGDELLFLSSDTLVPPHALEKVREHDLSKSVFFGSTVDLDTAAVFCGVHKVWPMCWFVAARKEDTLKCGAFDEKYCDGMAFEDNDFTARLVLGVGKGVLTSEVTCWHQSHPATAYTDDWQGFKRSEAYTRENWGGVPWRPNDSCFTWDEHRVSPTRLEIVPHKREAA